MLAYYPPAGLLTPRRIDLAVKWRFFNHLNSGNDSDAERIYRWHIETRKKTNAKLNLGMDGKENTDVYVGSCLNLFNSMITDGFIANYPIPVDQNGELLGGAHRVACALSLKLNKVIIQTHNRTVFAPPWGLEWFSENNMSSEDMERLLDDWTLLNA